MDAEAEVDTKAGTTVMKFIVLGLANSGKSSLVHRLKHGQKLERYAPSVGVVVHELFQDDSTLMAWDYGGRGHHRMFSKGYVIGSMGIIFMIDSTDTKQLKEALSFLNEILQDEVSSNMTVMVVANKQDLSDAIEPKLIEDRVRKRCKIRKDVTMFVMPMSATADDDHSLQLAFQVFVKTMKRKKNGIYHSGLIPHAWKTAEKMVEDSKNEEKERKATDGKKEDNEGIAIGTKTSAEEEEKETNSTSNPGEETFVFSNPIPVFTSLLKY